MDNKLCNSCGAFIDGLCNTIIAKDAEIAELKERLQKAEAKIERMRTAIIDDRTKIGAAGMSTKGHDRALMIIDEIMKEE